MLQTVSPSFGATLRLAKTGGELLNTYRQLEQVNGRYKQAKAKRIDS